MQAPSDREMNVYSVNKLKKVLKEDCTRRLRMILKSELNAKNKIAAVRASIALPSMKVQV